MVDEKKEKKTKRSVTGEDGLYRSDIMFTSIQYTVQQTEYNRLTNMINTT